MKVPEKWKAEYAFTKGNQSKVSKTHSAFKADRIKN